jgi:imidazolonepropionase-like amidohydrolase
MVLRSTLYARRTLLAGFTTVRNVGDHDYDTVALRNAVAAGTGDRPAHLHRRSPRSAPPVAMPITPTV